MMLCAPDECPLTPPLADEHLSRIDVEEPNNADEQPALELFGSWDETAETEGDEVIPCGQPAGIPRPLTTPSTNSSAEFSILRIEDSAESTAPAQEEEALLVCSRNGDFDDEPIAFEPPSTEASPPPSVAASPPPVPVHEEIPIMEAEPWLASPPPRPWAVPLRGPWVGALLAVGLCMGLWLLGLEPPSAWRLNRAQGANRASPPASMGQTSQLEHWSEQLVQALLLAEQQQFAQALDKVHKLQDATRATELPALKETAEVRALRKSSLELIGYWNVQLRLAESAMTRGARRDAAQVVGGLLGENQHLKSSVQAVAVKLEAPQALRDPAQLLAAVDQALAAHKATTARASQLQEDVARSQEQARTAKEQATTATLALQSQLRTTREQLALKEKQLKETVAKADQLERSLHTTRKALVSAAPALETPAHVSYAKGLAAFQHQRYPEAAEAFQAAIQADAKDARYHYYLGLARWSLGKREAAAGDFQEGSRLERENKPSQVFIQLALERIEGEQLAVLNRYRP
jgi:tetratricopeptide (TPR) repeat protein